MKQSLSKAAKAIAAAQIVAVIPDESDESLVFQRVDVVLPSRTIKFTCTVQQGSKLLGEFVLGLKFSEPLPQSWTAADSAARPIILGLGMAAISHVWTGFCTPTIVVKAGYLTEEQVQFWKDTYSQGLREHLLVNRITSFGSSKSLQVDIRVDAAPSKLLPPPQETTPETSVAGDRRVLVPLGGGKDSTAVLEMLKRVTDRPTAIVPFFLGDPEGEFDGCWRYSALCEMASTEAVCIADFWWPSSNYDQFQRARKAMADGSKWDDSSRLWAAMVCFASALAAVLRGCDHVAVGNERSANAGNGVSWGGVEVNHQYDKSFAFEARAHAYLQRCHGRVYYFSALMHLWDVQVVELFSRIARPYLPLILSCNEPLGHNNSRWCAECEKCAFVFALLSAFCDPPQVIGVFGDDLLQTRAATARFDELLGIRSITRLPDGRALPGRAALEALQSGKVSSHGVYTRDGPEARLLSYLPGHDALKPLDCVGTKEEATLALWLADRRRQRWAKKICTRCETCEGTGAGSSGGIGDSALGGTTSSKSDGAQQQQPTQRRPLAEASYFSNSRWKSIRAAVDGKDAAVVLALLDDYNAENNQPPWFAKLARRLHEERSIKEGVGEAMYELQSWRL